MGDMIRGKDRHPRNELDRHPRSTLNIADRNLGKSSITPLHLLSDRVLPADRKLRVNGIPVHRPHSNRP
jgi:hypothetical protein